jgi:UDP-glucose-4-epimerase GalE
VERFKLFKFSAVAAGEGYMAAILVTGGAGYIGSHCCKALSEGGFLPICYDNLTTGHADFVRWGPLIVGDIRNQTQLVDAIRKHDVLAVIHFAAVSIVAESVPDPHKYYSNNVVGSVHVVEAMREAGCKHIVFSSTGAVYGEAGSGGLSERLTCHPVNPYGYTKLVGEHLLTDYRVAYGLSSFSLRYFNAAGAHPHAPIGEKRRMETHLIPLAMKALTGAQPDFAIFGDDYNTPDGTAIRDYIHVCDLAAAHVTALRLLLEGHDGGCCNLGTGRGYSVKEVLTAISNEAGTAVPSKILGRRAGDPSVLVADPTLARQMLGFQPTCSNLKNIVSTAWAWQCAEVKRGMDAFRHPIQIDNDEAAGDSIRVANA